MDRPVSSNQPYRKVLLVVDAPLGTTGGQRFRVFRYTPYWQLLQEPEPMVGQDVPVQTTEAAG